MKEATEKSDRIILENNVCNKRARRKCNTYSKYKLLDGHKQEEEKVKEKKLSQLFPTNGIEKLTTSQLVDHININ